MHALTFPDAVPPATPMRNGVVVIPLDITSLVFTRSFITPFSYHVLPLPHVYQPRHVHSYTMLNPSIRLFRRWIRLLGVRCTSTDISIKKEYANQLVVRVAVIGLPNCGKSTLVNQLMKQKVKRHLC